MNGRSGQNGNSGNGNGRPFEDTLTGPTSLFEVGADAAANAEAGGSSTLDLSALPLQLFADGSDTLVILIEFDDAAIFALPSDNIEFDQGDDQKIELTGRRTDLQAYLRELNAITYENEEDAEEIPELKIKINNGDEEFDLKFDENLLVRLTDTGSEVFFGDVKGLPSNFDGIEDEANFLDFSDLNLKFVAKNRDVVTLELKASEGTFDVEASDEIDISGAGTDTIQLTGTRREIERYLNDEEAISYTGTQDLFGEEAASLTVRVSGDGFSFVTGKSVISLEDVLDVRIGTEQNDTLLGDDGQDQILGLGGDDYLIGFASNDEILGAGGNDDIRGGAGADTLDGGEGDDVLLYTTSDAGVTVSLEVDGSGFQQASGGHAEGDVVQNFEHVYASSFDDVIIGDAGDNILFAYAGNDFVQGLGGDDIIRGDEGADTLDGGEGIDRLRYIDSEDGVYVDLNADLETGLQTAMGGDAEGDVISNFENVQGGGGDDTLIGDDNGNQLIGGGGADSFVGGGGRDILYGDAGDDTLNGGDANDVLRGGSGSDDFVFDTELGTFSNYDRILDFQSGIDQLVLEQEIFEVLSLGSLDDTNFTANETGEAQDSDDFVVHNTSNGFLYYDADGSGDLAAVRFAYLFNGASVDENDFLII